MKNYLEWLNEASLKDLIKSTQAAEEHGGTKISREEKASEIKDIKVELHKLMQPRLNRQPVKQHGEKGNFDKLLVVGKMFGSSQPDGSRATYEAQILFNDVFFFDQPDLFVAKRINTKDGKIWYIDSPSIDLHNAQVRCSCPDFVHMWHTHNFVHGALFGQKLELSPSSGEKKPMNPLGHPGLCKHLFALVGFLQGQNAGGRKLLN